MGQALSRKRSGTANISVEKNDTAGVSSNGDVVKTEVNGSAAQTADTVDSTATNGPDSQAEGAPVKEKKKKRRFFFSLKRSRPGSGRKKKAKKDKAAGHDTSATSGKSNRSSLFMDEFQIPEDDGIDSVSLSSNEDKDSKKKKDNGETVRRSKRGSKSSKNGKKGKKKKQKSEKKKEEKSKKKNSKEEEKSVEVTAASSGVADVSLNVNQSVEPLHASIETAKDEAKATAVSEQETLETQTAQGETKEESCDKFEPENPAEDDLVAAVTAVMDSNVNKDNTEQETSKDSEDGLIAEPVVQEEMIQAVESVVQEAAVVPEQTPTSESSPSSPTSDSHQEATSPSGSAEEGGTPKRVSLGPRLKTAILKKYSGAGDSAPESQRVTLTKPKIVDVPDLVPPPRKNRARRLLSKTSSNISDANTSITSSDVNTSTTSSVEPTSPQIVEVKPESSPSPLTESVEVKVQIAEKEVAVTSPDSELHADVNIVSSEPFQKTADESLDAAIKADYDTLVCETNLKSEESSKDSAPEAVSVEALPERAEKLLDNELTEKVSGCESVEKVSVTEPAAEKVFASEPAEKVSDSVPDVKSSKQLGADLTLAQQAKMVVEHVMGKIAASFSESEPKEDAVETVAEPIPDIQESAKSDDMDTEAKLISTEETVLKEESTVRIESVDKDECILKEVEIIVVATKTYDLEPENDHSEKPEPVIIIERIHEEPYFGSEGKDEDELMDGALENTTVTVSTSSETVIKRQKYSKETGEICKECLCEEETIHVSRVTNIEQTINKPDNELGDSDTVEDTVESPADSDQQEQTTDDQDGPILVADGQKGEDADDSSSITTDSTIVDEDEQEKPVVVETTCEVTAQEDTLVEPSCSDEETKDSDEKEVAQEEIKDGASVQTESSVEVEDNNISGVNGSETRQEDVSSASDKCETADVKLNGERDTDTHVSEKDISDNNNSKDVISSEHLTTVQTAEHVSESTKLVQNDNRSSSTADDSGGVQ